MFMDVALDGAHHDLADGLGAVSASSGRSTSSAPAIAPARDQHLRDEEVTALEPGAEPSSSEG